MYTMRIEPMYVDYKKISLFSAIQKVKWIPVGIKKCPNIVFGNISVGLKQCKQGWLGVFQSKRGRWAHLKWESSILEQRDREKWFVMFQSYVCCQQHYLKAEGLTGRGLFAKLEAVPNTVHIMGPLRCIPIRQGFGKNQPYIYHIILTLELKAFRIF